MKDYLNREEKNFILSTLAVMQLMEGIRSITGERTAPIWDLWTERGNMTKEEKKNLKMAHTYLHKFSRSLIDRLSDKEQKTIYKQMIKYDFKLIDDFTTQKILRDMSDKMVNAVVPREDFNMWCEEIMHCNCKNCTKHHQECELYDMFENNLVPDGNFNCENCRYAYRKE